MDIDRINPPNIIKESSRGFGTVRMVDEMLSRREINLVGAIDEEVANSVCLQLRYLHAVDKSAPITIFINSGGGELASGLAIYDTMRAVGCPIRTVCMGMAASMAALLFAAGGQRDMLPHSRVMVHDPLIQSGAGGSSLALKATAERLMRMREITAEILSRHTGKGVEELYEVTASDTYFEAEEAVEFGLADRVIETF